MTEVLDGNFSLLGKVQRPLEVMRDDYTRTLELGQKGVFVTSGRHLQNGDLYQPEKLLELFSNCSTAMTSFMVMRLLLRGSGVGRDYSSDMCRVNWDYMPNVRLVLDESHPDFLSNINDFHGCMDTRREAQHKYDSESENVRWFEVEDSREGWAKVVEILETAAWQKKHSDKLFIFDFTKVRPYGTPIMGLQGRKASGPLSIMRAIAKVASIKGAGMKPWEQALRIDHYLAECVVMGGVRRSARMATKWWKDKDCIDFIDIKRGGFLFTANNSILVDAEFWEQAKNRTSHAWRVLEAACMAAYYDKTGEPGFINVDKLNFNRENLDTITADTYINSKVYTDLHPRTKEMIGNILDFVKAKKYPFIVNPCSEIVLASYGGYCVIGDVCGAYATKQELMEASGLMTHFLIRCNLMDSEYDAEVKRTNRIGVSLTGIHEFAWQEFQCTFHDLIRDFHHLMEFGPYKLNSNGGRFWRFIDEMRIHTQNEARQYAEALGVAVPHTVTTIKPSGTVSKVMNCTEGAHLPANKFYMRWNQYHCDDPKLRELEAKGYRVKDVSTVYKDHWVVGFPTKLPLVDMMGEENVICANEISPEENFKWLMLLERFWIGNDNPLDGCQGNQVSYTLKYNHSEVSSDEFIKMIMEWQSKVACCSVMPILDTTAYIYQPEEAITREQYEIAIAAIQGPAVVIENVLEESANCKDGVCSIEEIRNDPEAIRAAYEKQPEANLA
jgi:adenosylcobalamin-dependent ribonucleoside-triphosphate reductase